ncbi:MAG: hypothetical protein GY822_22800 [Deltaproteobacteria bacterium]|nr:hypothetical protein [Deltaproteobacteria bacterium]
MVDISRASLLAGTKLPRGLVINVSSGVAKVHGVPLAPVDKLVATIRLYEYGTNCTGRSVEVDIVISVNGSSAE